MSEVNAAPADATQAATPSNGATSPQNGAPKPQPEVDELGALLKKGAVRVKAGGKEHVIDSPEKLQRYLQRGIPVEQTLEAVAKERESLAPLAKMRERLAAAQQAGDEDAIAGVLEEMLDGGMLDKVSERRLRKLYEKEKAMEGLSEREKSLARELENARTEKQKLEAMQKQREEQARQQQEAQQVEVIKHHMGQAIVGTLKALDLPEKLEPLAVNFMKPIISAALRAGAPLDPALISEKVRPMLDELFQWQMRGLEGEKLVSRLGPEVGKKFRAALLAKLTGQGNPAPLPPANGAPAPAQPEPKPSWDPRKRW